MKLSGYRFLTDENIPPEVYHWLKSKGMEVKSVFESAWQVHLID